jgi:hypothetical protein
MNEEAGVTSELLEALQQDPSGGGAQPCSAALARVVDESPTHVFHDGDENGMNVRCMVLTGPFVGAEVVAMVSCPVGGGFESRPLRAGMRVLVQFLDGWVDGLVVVTASVPGGKENPLPKAMAGLAVDEGGLQAAQLVAPPKGVGVRYYVRGAGFVVRLKGTKPDFKGELYIEADDQANSPDGQNGTFIRLVVDQEGNACIKLRDAYGAFVQVYKGKILMQPPNGESTFQLSDDGLDFNGKAFNVTADLIKLDGTVMLNVDPTTPPVLPNGSAAFAKAGGSLAGVAEVSKTVFIGK